MTRGCSDEKSLAVCYCCCKGGWTQAAIQWRRGKVSFAEPEATGYCLKRWQSLSKDSRSTVFADAHPDRRQCLSRIWWRILEGQEENKPHRIVDKIICDVSNLQRFLELLVTLTENKTKKCTAWDEIGQTEDTYFICFVYNMKSKHTQKQRDLRALLPTKCVFPFG